MSYLIRIQKLFKPVSALLDVFRLFSEYVRENASESISSCVKQLNKLLRVR
jgi:hypothetical protein